MTPCLADLNFLLSVVVRTHPHHGVALAWYRKQAAGRIGVCRVVQLGLIRLLGNTYIMRDQALSARAAWDVAAELIADERVEFWPEPLGLDDFLPRLLRYPGPTPSLVADAYLAAFAMVRRAAVVTFDAGFRQFEGLPLELLTSNS